MKKLLIATLTILLLSLALPALCEVSPKNIVGVTTHAGYQDEAGTWHIFGCPDHGETELDGHDDLLQVEMNLHLTIALHTDGTLSFHGITGLPVSEISSWSGIQEFAYFHDSLINGNEILFALKDDGSIMVAHTLSLSEDDEYVTAAYKDCEKIATMSGVKDIVASESAVAFLFKDGNALVFSATVGSQVGKWQCLWGDHWNQFVKIEAQPNMLFTMTNDGKFYRFTREDQILLHEEVADFSSSSDLWTWCHILTKENALLTKEVGGDPNATPWRDGLYYHNPNKIDRIIGSTPGYIAVIRDGNQFICEGHAGETDFYAELSNEIDLGWYNFSALSDCTFYNEFLVVLYQNGSMFVADARGDIGYSRFNDPEIEQKKANFQAGDGPARQALHRQISGLVSYPYAVREDGSVLLLDEKASYIPEVLEWKNVAGISTARASLGAYSQGEDFQEANIVVAVTNDGHVLTACDGENAEALEACGIASSWNGVVQVDCFGCSIAALTKDGYVSLAGKADNTPHWDTWDHVTQVAFSGRNYRLLDWNYHTYLYALRDDGTVYGGLQGEYDLITLKGCYGFLYGVHQNSTMIAHGYDFLGDCIAHHLRGVWDVCRSMEWANTILCIGVDGRVYRKSEMLTKPYEGFENVYDVVGVFECGYGASFDFLALTRDGQLYSNHGDHWDLH